MIKTLLFTSLFLLSQQSIFAQEYIPFPYKIEKQAFGDSAMVVSAHPLATQVGIDILKKGGNAIDAAIAVQFALAVVYPQAGNIGGGGFLVYRSATGEVAALDYREKAPKAATETMYQDSAGNVLVEKSRLGHFACGVPGTVDGMWEAHKKYGKLPWDQLVEPAVKFAGLGYQITAHEAANLNGERVNFFKNCTIMPPFVRMANWEAGDWLIQKDLCETLKRIESDGRNGFYHGPTAALIVHEMAKKNGLISGEDLANYRSIWRRPLEIDYKDLHLITMPPPSSGGIILAQTLQMMAGQNLESLGFHTAASVHVMAEVERRAFADRAEHLGDPDFYKVPVKTLLDTAYLTGRMADFNKEKATDSKNVPAGKIKESEETTHFSIVDKNGNAVSVTTTLNDSYGSRVVVNGAGFILNNEMDDFSAKPGAPNIYGAIGGKANAIEGNKRPLSSMTPTIATQKGKLWCVLGTPGGTTIPTSVLQVLINLYEFKMPIDQAVAAKRFHHQWSPDKIQIEEGALTQEVIDKLTAMGHTVSVRSSIGRVEAIVVLPNGNLEGAADPRADDHASGY